MEALFSALDPYLPNGFTASRSASRRVLKVMPQSGPDSEGQNAVSGALPPLLYVLLGDELAASLSRSGCSALRDRDARGLETSDGQWVRAQSCPTPQLSCCSYPRAL